MKEQQEYIGLDTNQDYNIFLNDKDKDPSSNNIHANFSINETKTKKSKSTKKKSSIKREDIMVIEGEINSKDESIENTEEINPSKQLRKAPKIKEMQRDKLEFGKNSEIEEKTELSLDQEAKKENVDLSYDKIEESKLPKISCNKKRKRMNNIEINDQTTSFSLKDTKNANKKKLKYSYIMKTLECNINNIRKYIENRSLSKYDIDLELDKVEITEEIFKYIIKGNFLDIFTGQYEINKKEEYDEIEQKIKLLLEKEKKDEKAKKKILEKLFYSRVKIKHINYLNNSHFLEDDGCKLFLPIPTVKDDFPDYDKNLNKKAITYILNTITKKRRNVIFQCKNSIDRIIKFFFSDNRLNDLTINNQLGYSFDSYRDFFNQNLKIIYKDMLPRRVKKDEKYTYNIKQIENAIEMEKNTNKEEINVKDKLTDLLFKDYLILFLNDEKIIKIKEENGKTYKIELNNFITLKDCFNEEKILNKEEKKILKEDLMSIINGKKGRNPSQARNEKLRGKKYNK